jgi:hypothetical protein
MPNTLDELMGLLGIKKEDQPHSLNLAPPYLGVER